MPRRRTVPQNSSPNTSSVPVPKKPLIDISEEEQWRLIRETGILDSSELQTVPTSHNEQNEEGLSLGDEIFNTILLVIPFSSILLLMEILIRQQYGRHSSKEDILDRMLPGVPILSLFIFYTTRFRNYRVMQIFLFVLSTAMGGRLIYQLNRSSWLVNMKQCPPVATIWIYTIYQLDLGQAVLSLLTVASYVWWQDLKIML